MASTAATDIDAQGTSASPGAGTTPARFGPPGEGQAPVIPAHAAQLRGAVFGALWELDPELALQEELR